MNLALFEGLTRHPVTKATASPHSSSCSPATCFPQSLHALVQYSPSVSSGTQSMCMFYLLYAVARLSKHTFALDSTFFPVPTSPPLQLRRQGSHIDAAARNHCLSCMQSAVLEDCLARNTIVVHDTHNQSLDLQLLSHKETLEPSLHPEDARFHDGANWHGP